MSFEKCEPISFENEIQDQRWKDAMDEEIKVIRKNDIWELESLPKGKEVIRARRAYKAKKDVKGEIEIYKARFMTKGYMKQ